MNYTYQSFNFRNRQGARPFYDLVATPARSAMHEELVGDIKRCSRVAEPAALHCRGGRAVSGLDGQALKRQLRVLVGRWSRTDAQLLPETGARNNKLKVYEMVAHPAARALTGYCWSAVACTRWRMPGPGEPHGGQPDEAVPLAAHPDGQDPGVQAPHGSRGPGATASKGFVLNGEGP